MDVCGGEGGGSVPPRFLFVLPVLRCRGEGTMYGPKKMTCIACLQTP